LSSWCVHAECFMVPRFDIAALGCVEVADLD